MTVAMDEDVTLNTAHIPKLNSVINTSNNTFFQAKFLRLLLDYQNPQIQPNSQSWTRPTNPQSSPTIDSTQASNKDLTILMKEFLAKTAQPTIDELKGDLSCTMCRSPYLTSPYPENR